eukprot:scaffold2072_cov126-Isochrysis_galbana.AAC.6
MRRWQLIRGTRRHDQHDPHTRATNWQSAPGKRGGVAEPPLGLQTALGREPHAPPRHALTGCSAHPGARRRTQRLILMVRASHHVRSCRGSHMQLQPPAFRIRDHDCEMYV